MNQAAQAQGGVAQELVASRLGLKPAPNSGHKTPDRGQQQSLQHNAAAGTLMPILGTPANTQAAHTHTASLAQGLHAGETNLQRQQQLLQAPVSKRRWGNQHHWSHSVHSGLNVSVTSLASREPLNVLRLQQAGGSVQLGQSHQASHADSCARTELQPLAAGVRTQQRNFQKKEFWWELMSEMTSL